MKTDTHATSDAATPTEDRVIPRSSEGSTDFVARERRGYPANLSDTYMTSYDCERCGLSDSDFSRGPATCRRCGSHVQTFEM